MKTSRHNASFAPSYSHNCKCLYNKQCNHLTDPEHLVSVFSTSRLPHKNITVFPARSSFSIPQYTAIAPGKLCQRLAPCSKCQVVKWQRKHVVFQGISKSGVKQDIKVRCNKETGKRARREEMNQPFQVIVGLPFHSWPRHVQFHDRQSHSLDSRGSRQTHRRNSWSEKMPMGARTNAAQN